jgi:hypothetical protein
VIDAGLVDKEAEIARNRLEIGRRSDRRKVMRNSPVAPSEWCTSTTGNVVHSSLMRQNETNRLLAVNGTGLGRPTTDGDCNPTHTKKKVMETWNTSTEIS